MKRDELQFWFEFGSTYSYLSAARIDGLARDAGVALAWKPFLLGPLFAKQGWNDSPFNLYPIKGRYMWRDMERLCEGLGIPFRRPSVFPRNGLLAARVALLSAERDFGPAFVRAVYRANFAEDREISEPSVLAEILADLGQSKDAIEAAGSGDNKARLRDQTDEAARLGIFGAPSFVVARELFWGNDRLEEALAWIRRPAARPVAGSADRAE